MSMDKIRRQARDAGIDVYQAGDGADGDALAALFPRAWWAVVRGAAVATEHGPFGSEDYACRRALEIIGRSIATSP